VGNDYAARVALAAAGISRLRPNAIPPLGFRAGAAVKELLHHLVGLRASNRSLGDPDSHLGQEPGHLK